MTTHRKKPVLLYVTNTLSFFCTHHLAWAVYFQQHGYEVHVATALDVTIPANFPTTLTLHPFHLARKSINPWHEIKTLIDLYKIYKKLSPDIVHHFTIKPIIYGSLVVRFLSNKNIRVVNAVTGVGYVFTSQNILARVLRPFIIKLYQVAFSYPNQTVIFENADNQQLFIRMQIVKPEMTKIIPGSGIDPEVYPFCPEPEGKITILLAARLVWDKGVGEFVEAARQIVPQFSQVRFVLVGGVDTKAATAIPETTIHEWTQSGVVEWWGKQQDMVGVFRQAHIVCLPSYGEGLPRVLLEASCCGKPVIATDVPGCRDVVVANVTGLLVPARDSAALAEAIIALVNDPERRASFAQHGRQHVIDHFRLELILQETARVYSHH